MVSAMTYNPNAPPTSLPTLWKISILNLGFILPWMYFQVLG